MEYENITIITNKQGIQKVKVTIEKLQQLIPNLAIGKPRYGEIREQILISFKVSKDHLTEVIERLIYNEIKILPTTDEMKVLVDSQKNDYSNNLSKSSSGRNEIKTKSKKPTITISQLEEMSDKGNYEEVIKISKDMINYGQDLVDRAQKVLHKTVYTAIEKTYADGQATKTKAADAIEKLIKIAGESILRTMQKTELIKEAGSYAIELSKKYPALNDELIQIANNNKIHNDTNIKAVIAFSEIIKTDDLLNQELINYAVREINLRWLSIAFDVAQTSLSPEDLKSFNDFIEFIKTKRAGKADSSNN